MPRSTPGLGHCGELTWAGSSGAYAPHTSPTLCPFTSQASSAAVGSLDLTSESPPPTPSSARELCQEEQEGRARPQSPRHRPPGVASCLACFPAQPYLVCSLRAVGGGVGRGAWDTVIFAASMGRARSGPNTCLSRPRQVLTHANPGPTILPEVLGC